MISWNGIQMYLSKKIFVNGTFDVLHTGHLNLLKAAKDLGGFVLVAIDSDTRVKKLKGPDRPINSQLERMQMLLAIKHVDKVIVFSNDDELDYICKTYHPDVLVKGSDYINKPIIGARWCDDIHYVELNDKSTTKTIQSIIDR